MTVENQDLLEQLAAQAGASLVADAADRTGLGDTTAALQLRPVGDPVTIVGRARTARIVEIDHPEEPPYDGAITFIDSLGPWDVAVLGGATGRAACWGELFSTAAAARGARGALLDGLHRDTHGIVRLGFPVMSRGSRPADMAGRVALVGHDEPLIFGDRTVRSGDLVVADPDGVTVVPHTAAQKVARAAVEKARAESGARAALREGALLREAWEVHRVL